MKLRGFFFKMKGIIYKATNTLNGKVYIGQTVGSLAHRRGEHQRDAAGDAANHFHTALYQYPDLFEWEVIDTFHGTREEVFHALNVAEEYHILKHNSTDERFGYNATAGGYSSDKFAEHIKRRAQALGGQARAVLQYDADGNFVREFESINAVCAYLGKPKMHGKVLFGDGLHYGSQWREKTSNFFPKKIESYNPKQKPKATKILVYDKDGEFAGRFLCALDAEKATGIRAEYIIESSKGKYPQDVDARRKHTDFFFFRDAENYPKKINVLRTTKQEPEKEKINPAIAVLAYDPKSGEFVAEYASMSEAHTQSGASASTIRRSAHLPEPVRVESPKQKYVWRKKNGEVKARIDIIPYEVKTTERKEMEHRIIQYALNGELLKVWKNASIAAVESGESPGIIYKQLRGVATGKSTKFIWRHYAEDYPRRIDTAGVSSAAERESEPIVQLNRAGEVIARYADRKEAAQATGASISHVCNIIAGRVRHPKVRLLREDDYKRRYEGKLWPEMADSL